MSAKLTPYGVCYDLKESPFHVNCHGYQFKFSSLKHQESFMAKRKVKEEWLSDSLHRRFKMRMMADVLASFQLYTQVETRGFWVHDLDTGAIYTDSEDIQFSCVPFKGVCS